MIRKPIPVLLICLFILTGCNMPENKSGKTLNVTQAYQTVEARLTQEISNRSTNTPAPTPETPQSVPSATALPTTPVTNTQAVSLTATHTASPPPEASAVCDQAAAAYPKIDITIDDDTRMKPGQAFTKVWRIVNVGSCTWTPDYQVVFFSGEQMGAPANVPLGSTVPPNQSIDISIDMIAPAQAGSHQGNWKIKNTKGNLFGIGPHGSSPFWVRIIVKENHTPTPVLPSVTPASTAETLVHNALTISSDTSIDLDTGNLNSGDVDITYRISNDDPPAHQLMPQGNASIMLFGASQPDFASCQSAATSTMPIDLDQIAQGTYLCYHTGLSLPGWLRVDTFDPDNKSIAIEFTTWVVP